ncbi:hypothetical protein FRC03_001383 [Tulasnella sp. 419]|nr:hypothetical protein FRC03_001383 [Tulasnella sp. 419]
MIPIALATFLLYSLTSLSHAKTYDVTVGGPGKLLYDPEYVDANPGDYIRFHFQQKNHTATQSSFEEPCSPLKDYWHPGFDSGFMPVADNVKSDFPYFDIRVKDTKPIWVYCRQVNHCAQGMVFAVNPGNKFHKFKQRALATAGKSDDEHQDDKSTSPKYGGDDWSDSNWEGDSTKSESDQGGHSSNDSGEDSGTHSNQPGYTGHDDKYNVDKSYGDDLYDKPVDHKIVVGGAYGNVYTPSNIRAKISDTITFIFKQKNHTVTQSSFDNPCRKLEFTSKTGEIGFDSGFNPVGLDVADNFPTYTIHVKDDKPIWAYCRQISHCGQGMVFAANAPKTENTFEAFRANAIGINGTDATGATGTKPAGTSGDEAASEFAVADPALSCSSNSSGVVGNRPLVYTSLALNAVLLAALGGIGVFILWNRRRNQKAGGSKYFAVQEDKLGENPSLLGGAKIRPLSLGSRKQLYDDDSYSGESRYNKRSSF